MNSTQPNENSKITILPSRFTTIRLEVTTWQKLKEFKKEDQTFDDIIKILLHQTTKAVGNENIKAIQYVRKNMFLHETIAGEAVGFEWQYNDIKGNKKDFIIDATIQKVFFKKRALTPTEFFGVDNVHKHFSGEFLRIYFDIVRKILRKEFTIEFHDFGYGLLVYWKQLYFTFGLSEESFSADIEEPLRLSEEEQPNEIYKKAIEHSLYQQLLKTTPKYRFRVE